MSIVEEPEDMEEEPLVEATPGTVDEEPAIEESLTAVPSTIEAPAPTPAPEYVEYTSEKTGNWFVDSVDEFVLDTIDRVKACAPITPFPEEEPVPEEERAPVEDSIVEADVTTAPEERVPEASEERAAPATDYDEYTSEKTGDWFVDTMDEFILDAVDRAQGCKTDTVERFELVRTTCQ